MKTLLRHRSRHLVALAAAALLASGCSDSDDGGSAGTDAMVAESSIQLEVAPTSGTVRVGATMKFTVNRRTSSGVYPAPEAQLSSSDATIATIDPVTGVATGKAAGRVTLTAQWGPGRASVVLDVVP